MLVFRNVRYLERRV